MLNCILLHPWPAACLPLSLSHLKQLIIPESGEGKTMSKIRPFMTSCKLATLPQQRSNGAPR